RQGTDQTGKIRRSVAAGDLESREVIRRAAAVSGQHAREMAPHDAQALTGLPLGPGHSGSARGEGEIEGTAHPRNFELLRERRDGPEYRGKQVRVLVCIEMRGR